MTLTQARKRWATRRRQYAVGYISSGNLLFVKAYGGRDDGKNAGDPMSLREARQFLAQMPCPGAAIFQLAPIAVGGGRKR